MKAAVAALVVPLVLLAGCGSDDTATASPTVFVTRTVTASAPPAPVAAEPVPEPLGAVFSVESSCENEWPVVLDPASMSLVATAQVTNDGDRAGTALVVAKWYPVGSAPFKMTKTVRIIPGDTERVPFKVAPGQSVMNGMVGLQHGDEMCTVDVKAKR